MFLGNNKPSSLKFAIATGTGAFFTAVFFSFFSEVVLPKLQILMLSFLFLLLVIFIGIIFDMIGVATAVGAEHPFHAKATKKISGAKHAVLLIRNVHSVTVFCNDVVGDICGTVSGALGAAIVFQLVLDKPTFNESVLSIVMTGFVAALTVGGKAAGKHSALKESEKILFMVGRTLGWFESVTGISILSQNRRKGREKK